MSRAWWRFRRDWRAARLSYRTPPVSGFRTARRSGLKNKGGRVTEPLIQIDHVSKVYHRDTIDIPVLEDINLTVDRGEFLALMGPAGSGNTTLLSLMAGIDKPTRGRIRVGDREVSAMSETELARWRADHVGFI